MDHKTLGARSGRSSGAARASSTPPPLNLSETLSRPESRIPKPAPLPKKLSKLPSRVPIIQKTHEPTEPDSTLGNNPEQKSVVSVPGGVDIEGNPILVNPTFSPDSELSKEAQKAQSATSPLTSEMAQGDSDAPRSVQQGEDSSVVRDRGPVANVTNDPPQEPIALEAEKSGF